MNVIDILILVVTIYLVYIMVRSSRLHESAEFQTKGVKKRKHKKHRKYKNILKHTDVTDSNIRNNNDKFKFVEIQFHNDYKEIHTAIIKMSDQKQLFNTADIPVNHTKPSPKKTDKLIKHFLRELNRVIKSTEDTSPEKSGWNVAVPNENAKNGWDEHMESLGLPSSIYKPPSAKSHVKLLEVKQVSAMETEYDMRITCVLLCKKQNTQDQILLKVNFWIDKRDINEDRNIFNDNEDTYSVDNINDELKVVIEEIFIIGYYVADTQHNKGTVQDFYNFTDITGRDGMMNQEEILKQLVAKRKARALETGTSILSPRELEQMKAQIPHMTNFEQYRSENNIFSSHDSEE